MIPFLPGRRGQGRDDPHTRARSLAADRLGAPLGSDDEAWLETHLADCQTCTAIAAEYEEQRALLRGLAMPVPPRDLWARTSAAIERAPGPAGGRRRTSWIPLGALSGALVVAVVVGVSVLSMPPVNTPVLTPRPTIPSSPAPSPAPVPTPIEVAAGDVGWLLLRDDGTYALSYAPVDRVCAGESAPDCPLLDAPSEGTLILDAAPRAIVASPTKDQLVVVDAGTRESGGTVYVVAAPGPDPTVLPSLDPTASPSASPTQAPSSPSPSPSPTESPGPTESPAPPASLEPTPSALPTGSADPSASPVVEPSPSPSAGTGPIAIAADVIVVGETAAYSPDGRWFAFSARPADGTRGPDIYVWQAGMAVAQRATIDGRSVFAAWVGDGILGSRAVPPAAEPSAEPSADASAEPSESPPVGATSLSFLLDPATGAETILEGAGIWRPVVDPSGRYAVYWEGAIEVDASGVEWRPGRGRLVIAEWDVSGQEPSTSAAPGASDEPAASATPVVSAPVELTVGTVRDWDVRWDEGGTRFAIWLADPTDPTIGSLTLHELDPTTGSVDPNGPVLTDVPALAGFSIGDRRLAWATPPGQDGEGSRLQVLAWSGDDAGLVVSEPGSGSDPIVVVR